MEHEAPPPPPTGVGVGLGVDGTGGGQRPCAVELGRSVGEDATVSGDEAIPAPVCGGLHADDGLTQDDVPC